MRPQYNNNNNKNRNRNRNNNRRPNGGGGGQGGGNGANRVYDSNGPDVKVRGTAQTVAEKYMQLARDAHSSGDTVMAESYYQFSDHYYRVWLAAQPVGQPIQFSRRNVEDEYDEDGNEIQADNEQPEAEAGESSEQPAPVEASEAQPEGDGNQPRQNRNSNYNNNQNRDGNNNNRNFRQRWPRRNDRYNQDGQPEQGEPSPERQDRPIEEPVAAQREAEPVDNSNWEAPSFLTRPVPSVSEADAEAPAAPKRGRKPRAVAPVEDAPSGE